MWLFLINPLKLCSYGSWSLQGYVCKSSCCQCHILCLDIEMFKTWSVHFIDWWLCRSHSATQPLCQSGHSDAQPLSQSGWSSHSSHSDTQPLCQSGWSSHSALCHSARVAGAATQPLSHSATVAARVAGAATQPLSHSARVAGGAATQPLSHSARVAGAATQPLCQTTQPLSHSATVAARVAGAATQPLLPEWLMQPLSHSAIVAGAATQPLCQSGWSSHSDTQPLSQSAWSSHSDTLPEWLEQPLSHSVTQDGWVAEWLMWKFPPLRVQSIKMKQKMYETRLIGGEHLFRSCFCWSSVTRVLTHPEGMPEELADGRALELQSLHLPLPGDSSVSSKTVKMCKGSQLTHSKLPSF